MKVYVDPIPTLGIAMARTALALKHTAPPGLTVVDDPREADLQVLHAVDWGVKRHLQAPRYAVMMHCLDYNADPSGSGDNIPIPPSIDGEDPWAEVWRDAALVWSYYPLQNRMFAWGGMAALRTDGTLDRTQALTSPVFYGAPLGADGNLFRKIVQPREHGILTTGHVSGPRA